MRSSTSDAHAPAALDAARAALRQARSVVALSGAGISAESGIPTFRDALTGLWSRFDPADLASEEGFRAHPQRVWDWYAERREGVRRAEPNAAHRALAEFEQRHPGTLRVVTQNVDDLHQRAGSRDVVRLHGDILQDRWLDACPRRPACRAADAGPARPPRCAHCGNLVRPGVVWFGERLPESALTTAQRLASRCDAMLVVGTSGAVWPAAGLAGLARRAGASVVIVNPAASEIDDAATHLLRGAAAAVLPQLLAAA
ncbi:MAG: NAD-dependent deacylase [Proteobacteria bacterium]|nr:NAD-dependent deacylase [Pseudomonadota bacterium]HOL36950.1 NAD-dependent deacylase [Rubrivivax sp.]